MIIRSYVQVKATGRYVRRLLNLCISNNYNLWDIDSKEDDEVTFFCYSSDYLKMKKIIQKTHSKTKILSRKGLKKYFEKNYYLCFCLVSLILFLLIQTAVNQKVWGIKLYGNREIAKATVLEFLRDENIYEGCQKKLDYEHVEKKLINRFDNIVWCTIYLEKNNLVVEISEGINIER